MRRRAVEDCALLPKIARHETMSMLSHRDPHAIKSLTHLERLEAESIHIMREVVAETDNPVMLYSIGKDSSVMPHLALTDPELIRKILDQVNSRAPPRLPPARAKPHRTLPDLFAER